MPYLPIDPNEKVTATSGGATSQPIAQTGVATGGVGGGAGAGPQGGPKANNSYTNLTNYLQANAGNNDNANAAKSAVFDPLAQKLGDDNAFSGNAEEHRANLDTAVDRVKTTGGVQSALEQAYGNTYANQGNKALDAAISGRGVLAAGQGVANTAHARGPTSQIVTPPTSVPTSTITPANTAADANGKSAEWHDPNAAPSAGTSNSKTMTFADPNAVAPVLPNSGRTGVAVHTNSPSPTSGGYGHGPVPGYMAQGGLVPEGSGGHYENLMNKIRGKQ